MSIIIILAEFYYYTIRGGILAPKKCGFFMSQKVATLAGRYKAF